MSFPVASVLCLGTPHRKYKAKTPCRLQCASVEFKRSSPIVNGHFSLDQSSFFSNFVIRGYEVGPDRKASVITIANLLQENATNHAVALWGVADEGFAVEPSMVEKNLIWVLTRLQIKMDEYPAWGDEIEVETWLHPEGRIAVNREYIIKNSKTGNVLGIATSVWVCINSKTKRISRIPDDVKAKCDPFCPTDRTCPFSLGESRQKIPELNSELAICGPIRFAGHMQTDMNNHINNVAYLMWALDLLPDPIFEQYQLNQVEIDFKAECDVGSRVEGLLMEIEKPSLNLQKQFIHTLMIPNTEKKTKELIRLRTSWTH